MVKIQRKELIPNFCSRCGNDLFTGMTLFHLPFLKRYIVFCTVCHVGLRLPSELHIPKTPTSEEWKKFWEEELEEEFKNKI